MLSSINKLQKFFKLEQERGYDNKAIVGGLDKVLPAWVTEARAQNIPDTLIDAVVTCLKDYPSLDAAARADSLANLLQQIGVRPIVEHTRPAPVASPVPSAPPAAVLPLPPTPPAADADIPPSTWLEEPLKIAAPQFAPAQPPPAQYLPPQSRPSGLNAPLTVVKGIGEKNAELLEKLDLRTLEDLLYFFPRRYDDYTRLKPINRLEYGEEVTVLGSLKAINTRPIRNGAARITEAVLTDGTGNLRLSWFNQPWIGNTFKPGDQVVVSGKLDQYLGRLVMNSPEIEEIEREHLHTNRIVPVYSLTAGISQKMLRRWIYQAVSFWAPRVPDFLPGSVRSAVKLLELGASLLQTHFPDSMDLLDLARWRLAFDEIFLLQLGVLRQKRTWKAAEGRILEAPDEWLEKFFAHLPFPLTGAQQRSIAEIRADLRSGTPMNRLLQGDVGSGKTVVAASAAAMVGLNGAQSAIMAPTSILAEQHYRGLTRLLSQPDEEGQSWLEPGQIRLLVGDTPAPEKEEIRAGLANGEIRLIIGTHALIEDPVEFNDLQLVVIDEQHRFGVAQRASLRSKGTNPHLLVMTATPIPRSLALTVYGDLDLSVMDEMPAGRQPIETHVIHPLERERAYQMVHSQVEQGHQAFIIYPLIEESDKDEGLAAVENHARLQKEVFPKLKLGLLHGRMRPDEKEEVMRCFRDGEIQILVSTSVVEVGVDVPNATMMLIEGANRFGLAQLHQFRGRVGRGQALSYCLLIPDKEDALENQRLAAMEETNDGFILAEKDLEQRGPGDFLGTRQAGFSELRMAKLTDVHLIEKARAQAQALFQNDPELSKIENRPLAVRLDEFWGGGRGDAS
jgi:ATP-dependent DNA helicase RecG